MAAGLKLDASDVHFENEAGDTTRLRYRLDGILQDAADISSAAYQLLLSRIKMLSELKLNVHDMPQDGRFSFKSKDKEIEIRTSIIPADYGENIVLRILDPKTISLKLEDLGIQDYDFKIIQNELKKPNGMIITTGPTGSGKTTLLYAFLKSVNDPGSKIITLEDPIEYHLEGIEQTQVESEKGYTFASGLRSILRQDPDIILVGEIRDNETAATAINSALTGHLVFSTLHTNDAAGAIPRLVDMKVNPTMIPPALNLIIAQRLLRKVCPKCAKEIRPDKEILQKIKDGLQGLPARASETVRLAGGPKLDNITTKEANPDGCPYCNFTGYKSRIGVFELFIIDESMEKVILKTPSIVEIKESAIKSGMVLMKQDGLLKVLQKITTMDEVERILG
jgi:type II secretory ATPase GspE/PulE/Tfp pilus assembly ATPase PilB-like protein